MHNFQKLILSLVALSILSCGKSSSSSSAATPEPKFIFLSTSTNDGNIGGIDGADTICQRDANKPSLHAGATYKAMVVGNTRHACTTANCSGGQSENLNWVLSPYQAYMSADSVLIAITNENAIFSFPLLLGAAIDSTATGDYAWTGLSSDWTNFADNCNNWTDNNSYSGARGDPTASDNTSIFNSNPNCAAPNKLYCVEQ